MKKVFLIFVLSTAIICGKEKVLSSNDVMKEYGNTRVIKKSNPLTGKVIEYFPNGDLVFEKEYKNGIQEGITRIYSNSNGGLEEQMFYKNGKLHGKYSKYDIYTGTLLLEKNYKNGVQIGVDRKMLTKPEKYDAEKRRQVELGIARRKVFFEEDRTTLLNGEKTFHRTYDIIVENYKNGKKNGPSKVYTKEKVLDTLTHYKDNVREGQYISYFENGKIFSLCTYVDGLIEGKYIFYHENGKLLEERYYKKGKINGVVTSYWENGNLKSTVENKDGRKHGIAKYYRSDGSFEGELKYNNHEVVK